MSKTINLVLFGKWGNGKSSTGNSILGKNGFSLRSSVLGPTISELQWTKLKDGRILNVIDTPGLFDRSFEAVSTSKEIVRCANLAKDAIHAILMVFSYRSRLSRDEEAAIEIFKTSFGEKILNYVIVVFTGEDELESYNISFSEFICRIMHHSLKKFIQSCNGRIVLFDNKTCDKNKQAKQLECLMHNVDTVIAYNGGIPFSDNNFHEVKNGSLKLFEKEKVTEVMEGFSGLELTARGTKFVFLKIMQMVGEFDKWLAEAEEQVALVVAEGSEEANIKIRTNEDIRKLREILEQSRGDFEVFLK